MAPHQPALVGSPRGISAFGRTSGPETDFERALLLAVRIHGDDLRKGTTIPSASHLLAVAGLVMEQNGSPAQVIAALLHDAAEDHGGPNAIKAVRAAFGDDVARIVTGCSDALPNQGEEKEDWLPRKQNYLKHLVEADHEILVVSLADKIHNARAILNDVREKGVGFFQLFKAPEPKLDWTLEYYVVLADVFASKLRTAAARELRRTVDELCVFCAYHPRHSLDGPPVGTGPPAEA